METNIFDKFVSQKTLFKNKEHLRHNYRPAQLPHRQEEIEKISYNLWEALKGHIPSNMTLYGVTGAGKTAVTDYVCHHLKAKGQTMGRQVEAIMVNCRQIDTQYRVLSHIGNSLLEEFEQDEIPFTGWPTDRVFNELVRRMDRRGGVFVIVLDEIDHLVRKAGDDLLYNLTSMNASLNRLARVSSAFPTTSSSPISLTPACGLDSASWTSSSAPTTPNNSRTFSASVPKKVLTRTPSGRASSSFAQPLPPKNTVMPAAPLTSCESQQKRRSNPVMSSSTRTTFASHRAKSNPTR